MCKCNICKLDINKHDHEKKHCHFCNEIILYFCNDDKNLLQIFMPHNGTLLRADPPYFDYEFFACIECLDKLKSTKHLFK